MAQTQIKTPGIADGSITTVKLDSSIVGALVPVGGIIMWSGTTIPTGWTLCNGFNGTPNLANRFIVAASNTSKTGITTQSGTSPYDPGDVGGSADSIVVSHKHTITDKEHTHNYTTYVENAAQRTDLDNNMFYFTSSTLTTTPAFTGITETNLEGSSATNANLPPYYALAFIMRTS